MISQTLKITMLYDFYGALLTERQKQCIELHYLNDLSLAEIAEEFAVSRQAVHDMLKRTVQIMQEFEDKLALVARYEKQAVELAEIAALLKKAVQGPGGRLAQVVDAEKKLGQFLKGGGTDGF